MATKTLSVDETAYDKLKNLKRKGESFSDLIKRITSEKPLTEIAGIWTDDELRQKVEETRENTGEDLDRTAKELA
ncbi:MAG: antitoxin VapB family protein [Candidatus Nanohalobium sp.]